MFTTKHNKAILGKQYGSLTGRMVCDDCKNYDTDTQPSFADLAHSFQFDGWTITKSSGEWIHQCPNCNLSTQEQKDNFMIKINIRKKYKSIS